MTYNCPNSACGGVVRDTVYPDGYEGDPDIMTCDICEKIFNRADLESEVAYGWYA